MAPSRAESSPAAAPVFATTRWSMVLRAKGDSSGAHESLAALCEAYWYPLYAFVRRQGYPPPDAQDLTQEFFARLLAKGWLAGVGRERGKFRSWLLASLKHFLANEWDRAQALKRGGQTTLISFDDNTAEVRYRREPVAPESADQLYDRRWALTLLDRVLAHLRAESERLGKLAQFEALKGALTGEKTPYAEIAVALDTTEGAIKVAVHRLRERYRALLRAEIAETVATPAEIDEELRHLLAALSS
jgi:RNA polymerase sigma factor (sigma-70 family)